MSFFDELFSSLDVDYRQARQLEQLKGELQDAKIDAASTGSVRRLQARVDRLELLNRALVDLLLHHSVVSRDELSVMMQQVDLLDGVEDGAISESVHEAAPMCGSCGRYVNPSRTHCVYCNTVVSGARAARPAPRVVGCRSCGKRVEERRTFFSEVGVVCRACFQG